MEGAVGRMELLKASQGFNPYNSDGAKIDKEIQQMLEGQKPPSHLIEWEALDLQQDTLYEFRVRLLNAAGFSPFSQPSHRAKTNRALVPAACAAPACLSVGFDYVILRIEVPAEGGSAVKMFTVEVLDLDAQADAAETAAEAGEVEEGDEARIVLLKRHSSDREREMQCRVPDLRAGGIYVFRVRAESLVGVGGFSEWSGEVQLPVVLHDAHDTSAA
ncbi:hypothetical protein B484DRAFT_415959, partial [Ochromonadaceae sp. CCMP2298]